jgi:hypothetical protein
MGQEVFTTRKTLHDGERGLLHQLFALVFSIPHERQMIYPIGASDRSTVSEARLALPHFDNVTVWIADVAASLAILRDRLGDELRSSTFP